MSRPESPSRIIGNFAGASSAPPRGGTPLVGRERERAEIAELLVAGRLLTLIGAGGCGKTRLAATVAADLELRREHRVFWVELAGVREPAMVSGAAGTAMGVRERPGQDLVDTIAEHIDRHPLLLVLDNCEHLVDACAELVGGLLRACPRLTVLATSREPLAIEGETTMPVSPLTAPEPDSQSAREVSTADAARLFELRARQMRPDFRITDENAIAVAEICRRLDGIPLAIELAAVRVRVLTPAQIAEGLSDRFRLLTSGARDAPPRQRTLEASIDWSYGLLTDAERLTLARLSVFAAEADIEAVEAVVSGDGIEANDVLDLITALAERSLLQVGERHGRARYRLLETVRVYAHERLTEIDEPARVRDRQLEYTVELARRARDGLAGPASEEWMTRLADGLDDLRAALDWAFESRRPLAVLAIAEPTIRFWLDRGFHLELRRRVSAADDSPAARDVDRARGSVTAALLALYANDHTDARSFPATAVPLSRAAGINDALALALILRAWSGFQTGLSSSAEVYADVEEAVALGEQLQDHATRAHVLVLAGGLSLLGRSLIEGSRLLERSVAVCRDSGVPFHLSAAHALLSMWPLFVGDIGKACEHATRALELSRRLQRPGFEGYALAGLALADLLKGNDLSARVRLGQARGVVSAHGLEGTILDMNIRPWIALAACRSGDPRRAREEAEAIRHTARKRSNWWEEARAEWLLGVTAQSENHHEAARDHFARCRDMSLDPLYPFTLGRSLIGLASLICEEGDPEGAWELAHNGLATFTRHGDRVGIADAIETLAAVAIALDQPDQALRLLGASDRFRADAGITRFPVEADRYVRSLAAARALLETSEVESCLAEGAALSLEEAVDYARRGRGERGRPRTGWSSLTPMEREVARLVAEGCTNAEIGERLFVSVNTVKTHLSRIYAKVAAESRAALAAEATRHL